MREIAVGSGTIVGTSSKIGFSDFSDPINYSSDIKNTIESSNCCDPSGVQIVWWYVPIGGEDYGIHVNWDKWEKNYHFHKKFKNETFEYYHEYFHHIIDYWQNKHDLNSKELGKEYESIWTKEDQKVDGYQYGILLGEALAERFAAERQDSLKGRRKKSHPSYSLDLTRSYHSAYCSIHHVYQIMNKTYEIYEKMDLEVPDRTFKKNITKEYEAYEDEIFSAKSGFRMSNSVYEKVLHQPANIPFYVHGADSEERIFDVLDFVRTNHLSVPHFRK